MIMRRYNRDAERATEIAWEMRDEILWLFDLICAEFESDPTSTACFDSRLVRRAIELNREYPKMFDMGIEMRVNKNFKLRD